MTRREGIGVAVLIAAVCLVQLAAANAFDLFSRHFWVDELYSHAVVADPSWSHALQAIHGGLDSLPTYQLALRVVALVIAPTEVALRSFAFASVVLALVGVYALLRHAVSPLVALTAAAAVWAHPMALSYAFDARYYGPFLAIAVWFCWIVHRRHTERTRATTAALTALSLLLCGVHVFGVLVLAAVLLTAGLVYRQWRAWLPALVGPVLLPPLWFLALQPQRQTITVATWEGVFSWSQVLDTASSVFVPGYLAAVFLGMFAIVCLHRVVRGQVQATSSPGPAESLTLLAGLSLLFPAIVLVSYFIQPTLTPRYFIPAIVALAPAIAHGLTQVPRWGTVVILVFLLGFGTNQLRWGGAHARSTDQRIEAMAGAIRALPADRPVLFEVTHELAVLWKYAPDLRNRVFWIDFEDGELPHPSAIRIVSRDLARAYSRFYDGQPGTAWSSVEDSREFYVIVDPRAWAADGPASTNETRYPGFTLEPAGIVLMRASKR